MRITIAVCTIGLLLATGTAMPEGGGPVTIAIIVNKANIVDMLSAKQLKQIFSGEKARWPDGQKIQTLAAGSGPPDYEGAIQFLFGMNETEYRKYRLHASFTGNLEQIPREPGLAQVVVNLVAFAPGAIGFVRADLVNPSVKVIKIDGFAPGAEGYPLAGVR
jgi:ABC-type phosphate transport system substrate-binding protein